jgi:ketopantoate reductase
MAHNILILGASYGSLLGTKLLMAGHNVTLVCREETAKLINEHGTEVRIRLKGEDTHRTFRSKDLPGRLDAQTPENVAAGAYDLVGLAMQEPQYSAHSLRTLLIRSSSAFPAWTRANWKPPIPIPGSGTVSSPT